MKAIFQFDLSNPEDRISYRIYSKADDLATALLEIASRFRSQQKHGPDAEQTLEMAATIFYGVLEEYGINLDELG